MKKRSFDNLPPLSKDEALNILAKPISQLKLSSDYYKAVHHLYNFPGADTEHALLKLVESPLNDEPISIARRKAVEILASHGCLNAIPAIGKCLESFDTYLVESSVWALQELGCKEQKLINIMLNLLDDPKQNRRLLIQALSNLGVMSLLPYIKLYLQDMSLSSGILGASIAALNKLTGDTSNIKDLVKFLSLPNQNDRQCAVNDVINSGETNLLPYVLKTPVAPSFRIRALNEMWPEGIEELNGLDLFCVIDSLIRDDPNDLELPNLEHEISSTKDNIVSLFDTDFSKSCLALRALNKSNSEIIWPVLSQYLDEITRDYGALYFAMILFRSIPDWNEEALAKIREVTLSCLGSQWPDFIKFKPVAILALMKQDPSVVSENMSQWLNQDLTPYWVSRYAALIALESLLEKEKNPNLIRILLRSQRDPHRFISGKAKRVELKLLR